MSDRKQISSLTSLAEYRLRKIAASTASNVTPPSPGTVPPLPASFTDDHRLAFLAAAEQHDARALCFLLNGRTIPAALHHVSALLLRTYAQSSYMQRLEQISGHLQGEANVQNVHKNTITFLCAGIEAFYYDHSKETQGEKQGRFSVVDDAASIAQLFCELGYERSYNASVRTYNVSLHYRNEIDQQVLERQNTPVANT